MHDYAITFATSARKELQALEKETVNRIFMKIFALSSEPRPAGCKKLIGFQNLWRIRVGDYRIIYSIYDSEKIIDISAIKHRKDAY
jgi:mRNA interferase RelE/StbE